MYILLIVNSKRDDIDLTKIVSCTNFNVNNILTLLLLLEYVGTCTTDYKINTFNILVIHVYILVLLHKLRL